MSRDSQIKSSSVYLLLILDPMDYKRRECSIKMNNKRETIWSKSERDFHKITKMIEKKLEVWTNWKKYKKAVWTKSEQDFHKIAKMIEKKLKVWTNWKKYKNIIGSE